ncbi:RusA family crossover junction endodeoxyribonuclease [Oligoflexus sp.]|uniref:RusA family crossover junction endodeoxyribonuclease n=1 Tax=Oligoflexus sp. TaxID=1971216 RepID=UPI002D7761E4|nr:RusA family crossover junction endodeoxyribonuclease [Oligoflexus sp.]
MFLKFTIPLEPEGKKEARRNQNGHVFKHPDTRRRMEEIAGIVRAQYPGEPIDGPIFLRINAYRTRPKGKKHEVYAATKPDCDNIEKLIGDALEGILWVNDSRIVDGRCLKKYAPMGVPGWIDIEVGKLDVTAREPFLEEII